MESETTDPQPDATKHCPFCAEKILAAAIKCRYCGEMLTNFSEGESQSVAQKGDVVVGGIVVREDFAHPVHPISQTSNEPAAPTGESAEIRKGRASSAATAAGVVGVCLSLFALFLPYFVAAFFVPIGIISSLVALVRGARIIGIVGLAVGLLGIVGVFSTTLNITNFGGDSSKIHHVKYTLTGTASRASITIQNPSGGSEQHIAAIPWTYEFEANGGAFVYLSAQNQDSGSLRAAIYVDGAVLQAAESTEEYGIASVSGSVK